MTHELTLAPPCPPDPAPASDVVADWRGPGVDIVAAEQAAADFLAALGVDLDEDGLRETPGRMARAYAELFEPAPLRLTTFDNTEGYD
ncbi:MAG: GTP cyclohydrolase I [Nocardiopsaceae bacterium]|jgi:GTP cyclohydrolase I|nr:GTP cyclohydrolase I [Nocardiopsaceae bacterium]